MGPKIEKCPTYGVESEDCKKNKKQDLKWRNKRETKGLKNG